jgi:hypothetical protein
MLYGVIAGLFKELDRTAAGPGAAVDAPVEHASITYLEQAYGRAEGYFRRAAQRRAQMRYLAGIHGGLIAIAGVGFLLARGLATLPELHDQSAVFLASLIAGGAGAMLSVLYGMTSGNCACTRCSPARSPGSVRSSPPPCAPSRRALGHRRLRAPPERARPAQGPDGVAGTHFYIAVAILARLQRALGARRARGYRGADPVRHRASRRRSRSRPLADAPERALQPLRGGDHVGTVTAKPPGFSLAAVRMSRARSMISPCTPAFRASSMAREAVLSG